MDDLLREFLTETSENIAQLDIELVRLEQNPNDPELIGSIFRLVHTVKGTCGFLGLTRLEHVAHAGENVLGKFRDRKLDVTPHAVTLILQSIDTIKSLLAYLEQHEAEQPGHDEELIAQLNAMADGKTAPDAPAPAPAAPIATAVVNGPEPDEFGFVPVPVGETGLTPTAAPPVAPPAAPPAEVAKAEPAQAPVKPVIKQDVKPGGDDHAAKDSVANQSIRVDLSTLEKLMTTVSELVLTRNQLLQILRDQKDAVFATPLQRLNQVTSELQESVMKTRMQPIGNAWSKLPRIVRDLSVELGKKIDLQMVGADTELDRQVLELIKDPLTHMVRNSGDHGIEKPIDRVAAGKPETGTILLNAYHQGGHIIIEISDDGKGLDLERIKSKVLQNNMATEAEVAGMSSQQIMQFIFKAGFSTAAQVTAVARLEQIERKTIEYAGGAPVVQYRGKLMPLIPIDKSTTLAGKGFQPILVFADRDRNMGLIVDEIIDIVEDFVKVDLATQRPGCFGTSIISGEATDIVDATYYLTQAFKDWFGSAGAPGFGQKEPHHILLVDDSPFFRNLLTPFLTVAGYKVTIADNPIEALKLQETGIDFDAIISDIEMPKMNGFDFAATVRREGRWSQLPILAMSAHATPEDLERGRQVGFTDYVAKYNRDDLLASLNRTLGHQPSLGNDVREGAQA